MRKPKTRKLGKSLSRFAQLPVDSTPAARNGDGTFAKGNLIALKTGKRSVLLLNADRADTAAIRQALAARRADIEADLGGVENISTIRRDLVTRYLSLSGLADWQEQDLIKRGLFTPKGQSRAMFSAYLQTVDRLHRLAQTIGLERHQKRIPTLEDHIARRQRAPELTEA